MVFGLVWFLYLNETANASVDGGCPGSSFHTAHSRRSSFHCASSCWRKRRNTHFTVLLNNDTLFDQAKLNVHGVSLQLIMTFSTTTIHPFLQIWENVPLHQSQHQKRNNNRQCNKPSDCNTLFLCREHQTVTLCCKSQDAIQAEALSTTYISSAADG